MKASKVFEFHGWALLLICLVSTMGFAPTARAQVFSNGDVFVAIGNGSVQWRGTNGVLIKTLVAPVGANLATTGMAFDQAGNLYVTMFDSETIARFDSAGNFIGTFGSGYDSHPESILFDTTGNAYVGQADGTHRILKFDPSGNPLAQFTVNTEDRGSDWIDLAADHCTMYYTSEGTHLKAFDVCANQQLPDVNTTAFPGTFAYAHRLLPNGETLVADSDRIVRLDDTGAITQTYTVPNENNFFALNVDPDGRSFWSADLTTGDVFKFDIATGNVLLQFNAGASNTVAGIVVKGEITALSGLTSACVTRNSRFWSTHAFNSAGGSASNCVTLLRALHANIGGISLGFIHLPVAFENADSVKDENDAVVEALAFYWKGKGHTALCKKRKLLAQELISATANVVFLGTAPSNCSYFDGTETVNFPANLLTQARQVARGGDTEAIVVMTALLRKFNENGVTNNFVGDLVECSPDAKKTLKHVARDATTQFTCPGVNDNCVSAEEVLFSTSGGKTKAKFSRTVDTRKSTTGQVFWKITPPTAGADRTFTVDSSGSNFNPDLAVLRGTCTLVTSNGVSTTDASGLTEIVNNGAGVVPTVTFSSDGTSTFFVRAGGGVGKVKIVITSP